MVGSLSSLAILSRRLWREQSGQSGQSGESSLVSLARAVWREQSSESSLVTPARAVGSVWREQSGQSEQSGESSPARAVQREQSGHSGESSRISLGTRARAVSSVGSVWLEQLELEQSCQCRQSRQGGRATEVSPTGSRKEPPATRTIWRRASANFQGGGGREFSAAAGANFQGGGREFSRRRRARIFGGLVAAAGSANFPEGRVAGCALGREFCII